LPYYRPQCRTNFRQKPISHPSHWAVRRGSWPSSVKKRVMEMKELAEVIVNFRDCKTILEDPRLLWEYRDIEGSKHPSIDPWDPIWSRAVESIQGITWVKRRM